MANQEKVGPPVDRSRDAYNHHRDALDDFWRRKSSAPVHHQDSRIFGHQMTVTSNHPGVMEAVDLATRSYSTAAPSGRDFTMRIVVDDQFRAGVDPAGHLPDEILYVGSEDWLAMRVGRWGQAHVDLRAGTSVVILGPDLASKPGLIARWIIDTIWTNFLIRSGYGMLHATALHRDGTLVAFVAPHDSGKSTTALRLALDRGFLLLSDSLLFVDGCPGGLRFNAFPVGRVSLRRGALDAWPHVREHAIEESIRSETKYFVNLAAFAPEHVQRQAVCPNRIFLFLLERHDHPETVQHQVDPKEVTDVLIANSMFYDTDPVWMTNLEWITALSEEAATSRLLIGTDTDRMLDTIERAIS